MCGLFRIYIDPDGDYSCDGVPSTCPPVVECDENQFDTICRTLRGQGFETLVVPL